MRGKRRAPASALSQLDAFFVAYQERAGVLMQLGVEVTLRGPVRRELLEQTLEQLTARWPRLGQTLRKRPAGLAWGGECQLEKMLRAGRDRSDLARWRNLPLDPFREPPFQMLHVPGDDGETSTLAIRAHHSVADGESFFEICLDALRALARLSAGESLPTPAPETCVALHEVVSPARLLRQGKLGGAWRYARRLAAESKARRGAAFAARSRAPGDTATRERPLDADAFAALKRRASDASVSTMWLCASAWARAIGAWNASRGRGSNSLVSLEVPVSLRPRGRVRSCAGNFISPLVLFADSSRPLEEVARALRDELRSNLRRRAHAGVPALTSPARFLPWPLFRRLAVNTTSTGFATSHFTWLEHPTDPGAEVRALSGGALRLLDARAYTPVCLHMGAALAVIVAAGNARLSLTYRLAAFDDEDAGTLLELLAAELSEPAPAPPSRARADTRVAAGRT